MKPSIFPWVLAATASCVAPYAFSQDSDQSILLRQIRDQMALQQLQQQQVEPRGQSTTSLFDQINSSTSTPERTRNTVEQTRQLQLQNEIMAQCLQLLRNGESNLPSICNSMVH